ncbi:methionine--tRNA ligase [Gemmatimonadota bacterium]
MNEPDASRFYVTTPIYYVNGTPHIGHAYTTILADVLTRYHRLFGKETWFLTGTDEHGLKVQEAANNAGMEPKEYCDGMVGRFVELWEQLGIRYDRFIRTTDADHVAYVQEVLQKLYEKGDIYSAPYQGWYCVPDERFWTEKDIVDGNCPDCGRQVIEIEEENYFFKMGSRREWLIEHIEANPGFIFPDSRRNEVLGFLHQGLGDLCISRPKSRLAWGIPLPFDSDYVTYVWFDALLNYVTATLELDDPRPGEGWWPADLHLIGKDIVTTHCVYWPTMLKAADLPLPDRIAAHGWWLVDEEKMSKSVGNVVKPLELADRYGVDPFRYFLMRDMTVGLDRSFSEVDMIQRYNSDLANDLGNAVNRVTKMIGRYSDGVIGSPGSAIGEEEKSIQNLAKQTTVEIRALVESLAINQVIEEILGLVRATNRYLELRAPWQLARDESQSELLVSTLYTAAEALRIAGVLLSPVMPVKAEELMQQLGATLDIEDGFDTLVSWGLLEPGTLVPGGDGIFPRIELPEDLKE